MPRLKLKARVKTPMRKPGIAREFQPPALALEDEGPRGLTLSVLFTLTALLLIGIIWASIAEVDEVVIARGQLVTSAGSFTIQPLDRTAIMKIQVKVGDFVHKGDVLATLDPTFASADVAGLEKRVASFTARVARLQAELSKKPYEPSENENTAELLEKTIYETRKHEYEARIRAYDEELSKINASLLTQRTDYQMQKVRIAPLNEMEHIRETMVAKEFDSRVRLLEVQIQRLTAERDATLAQNRIVEIEHEYTNKVAERQAYIEEWSTKIADELATTRRDRDSAEDDLTKARRRQEMNVLLAPQDAEVHEIAQRAGASVLREGEPLFTLVPVNDPLEAEVRVLPLDVGRIRIGDNVRIKFDAFPFQKYGTGEGKLVTISADAFANNQNANLSNSPLAGDEKAQPFHKARIELTSIKLHNLSPNYKFIAGMTVTAEIKVGKRKVLSYLLYPIFKGFDEAAREP